MVTDYSPATRYSPTIDGRSANGCEDPGRCIYLRRQVRAQQDNKCKGIFAVIIKTIFGFYFMQVGSLRNLMQNTLLYRAVSFGFKQSIKVTNVDKFSLLLFYRIFVAEYHICGQFNTRKKFKWNTCWAQGNSYSNMFQSINFQWQILVVTCYEIRLSSTFKETAVWEYLTRLSETLRIDRESFKHTSTQVRIKERKIGKK